MTTNELSRMDRRTAIKWMLTAAASTALIDRSLLAAVGPGVMVAKGYGTDPDLLKSYKPGDFWPLTFTKEQRQLAAALCDVILPADEKGPAASTVGVPDFIDEWISAPYPGHDRDRKIIVEGLAWVDAESQRRFGRKFNNLVYVQVAAICDDICGVPEPKPEHKEGAQFFRRFRDLASGGYYTSKEGMKDIGYVGNVQLKTFDGPPPEVLKILGLA